MRLAVAATPEVALPTLNWLLTSEHDLVRVISQPDRPSGRGQELHASAVSEWAKANSIELTTPTAIAEIDAAICDGDYVVIRSQKDCNNGEIVAAMIDGEATVKTFSRKNGHIWLLPANDDFAPIDGDNCEILGKVTAVIRSVR